MLTGSNRCRTVEAVWNFNHLKKRRTNQWAKKKNMAPEKCAMNI